MTHGHQFRSISSLAVATLLVATGTLACASRETPVATAPDAPPPAAAPGTAAAAPAADLSTTAGGVFSAAQAVRGSTAYAETCSFCHGDNLGGGDSAPSLAGDDFMFRWEAQTVGDLIERTRISMPLDNPGSLTAQGASDIIAHILQVNGFPAGAQELNATNAAGVTIRR